MHRRTLHDEHGYVLVLAMLVMVVLSGVGVFALRTSRIDLRATSNLRLGSQAEYVAEAAVQRVLVDVMNNPALVVAKLQGAGGAYQWPAQTGLFGETNPETFDALGYGVTLMPQSTVILSRPIDVSPSVLPGYMIGSVGGTTARFRLKRVDITSTGVISPQASTQVDQRTASARIHAHVMLGPL